jgi:hypothetical protein
LFKSTQCWVLRSEPNMSAKEMWFASYGKNVPIKLELLLYHDSTICFLPSNNAIKTS